MQAMGETQLTRWEVSWLRARLGRKSLAGYLVIVTGMLFLLLAATSQKVTGVFLAMGVTGLGIYLANKNQVRKKNYQKPGQQYQARVEVRHPSSNNTNIDPIFTIRFASGGSIIVDQFFYNRVKKQDQLSLVKAQGVFLPRIFVLNEKKKTFYGSIAFGSHHQCSAGPWLGDFDFSNIEKDEFYIDHLVINALQLDESLVEKLVAAKKKKPKQFFTENMKFEVNNLNRLSLSLISALYQAFQFDTELLHNCWATFGQVDSIKIMNMYRTHGLVDPQEKVLRNADFTGVTIHLPIAAIVIDGGTYNREKLTTFIDYAQKYLPKRNTIKVMITGQASQLDYDIANELVSFDFSPAILGPAHIGLGENIRYKNAYILADIDFSSIKFIPYVKYVTIDLATAGEGRVESLLTFLVENYKQQEIDAIELSVQGDLKKLPANLRNSLTNTFANNRHAVFPG